MSTAGDIHIHFCSGGGRIHWGVEQGGGPAPAAKHFHSNSMVGGKFSSGLFHQSSIGSRRFQRFRHLFNGRFRRIVNHLIDLFASPKTVRHLFYAVQRFQRRFADIVSVNVKYRL